jgi:hypothetical protein
MKLELGGELPEVKIHFEEWGEKDVRYLLILLGPYKRCSAS